MGVAVFLYIIAGLVVWLTFWTLIPHDAWWVRGADFPRLQLFVIGMVVLIWLIITWRGVAIDWVVTVALVLALAYQARMILPFTPLYPKQIKQVRDEELNPSRQISLLVSNVLTPNRDHHKLITHIQTHRPDVVLTLESDAVWEQALSVIEPDYPYTYKVPLDNLYGMHFYSRLPVLSGEIKYLLSEEIPSIHALVRLPCGKPVRLHCLHPQPPSPTEADTSTLRDAELLIVGRAVKDSTDSCIVMGDLNDVAWSRTTQLFSRISGLLDPRIGRYFINTFHADYVFLRWSLDHIFHSSDFALVKMERLSHIGSDHFAVLTVLQFDGKFEVLQDAPTLQAGDMAEAVDKIQDGLDKANADCVATTDSLN